MRSNLDQFLAEQLEKYPREDLLKIDLHCHDCNSDEPDELGNGKRELPLVVPFVVGNANG